ncbi:phage head-tail connector protein [Neiella sp. HB171785]|uniref:Phage head-tail connector protein n=1 Tax=Neiella litorisoli TaxID=2771431 RepID=A0A8J6QF12_9GAMM|nr:head-tail connector protein [Neiella litorisoli]MBD1388434.1 phage head-tail connector protein [Neiella litorisoli]
MSIDDPFFQTGCVSRYVSLRDVKRHLGLMDSFTLDDGYLLNLIEQCGQAIDLYCGTRFSTMELESPPKILQLATLTYVAIAYRNRDMMQGENSRAIGAVGNLPRAVAAIVDPYKQQRGVF